MLSYQQTTNDNGSDGSPLFQLLPQLDIYKTIGESINEVKEKKTKGNEHIVYGIRSFV